MLDLTLTVHGWEWVLVRRRWDTCLDNTSVSI
jgi:hypothetical protein